MNVKMNYNRDRIKGLILWRFNAYCGAAAIHEVECSSARGLWHLVDCSSHKFEGSCCRNARAAIHDVECCTISGCRSCRGG